MQKQQRKAKNLLAGELLKCLCLAELKEIDKKDLKSVLGGNIIGDLGHKISEKWRSYDSAEQLKIIGGFIFIGVIGLGIAYYTKVEAKVNNHSNKLFEAKASALRSYPGNSHAVITEFDDYYSEKYGKIIFRGLTEELDENGKNYFEVHNNNGESFLMTWDASAKHDAWLRFQSDKTLNNKLTKKDLVEIIAEFENKVWPGMHKELQAEVNSTTMTEKPKSGTNQSQDFDYLTNMPH